MILPPGSWIVFDVSGIILTDGLAKILPTMAAELKVSEEVLRTYLVGKPAELYRTGNQPPEIFWQTFATTFQLDNYTRIRAMFFEAYKLVEEAPSFLARLPRYYSLASFSYSPPDRAKYLEEKYGFPRLFERSLYGSDVNASKFEPEAYSRLARLLGSEISEVLMIDDRKEFVEASIAAGLPTILFQSFETLESQLKGFGIQL